MRNIIVLISSLVLSVMVSCSNPKNDAVEELRYLYEEMSANSEYYTQDEWAAILQNYAVNDSIIRSYEYSPEEQKEIDELRGRCSAYLVKGAAKGAASELEELLKRAGDFMDGFMDEFEKSSN